MNKSKIDIIEYEDSSDLSGMSDTGLSEEAQK